MKNVYYKTIPINEFSGICESPEKEIKSTLYINITEVFQELMNKKFIKSVDWRTPKTIRDARTNRLFNETFNKAFKNQANDTIKQKFYEMFIEIFFGKFVFSNDLVINQDAVKLFQADFLGWEPDEID
ncbi:MAG TPA: hypothetical protein PLF59_08310 [Cyclobacteriaceae bacterium]|nr:hypothetical protein [Cyclobacteriaceae bacterium]